MLLVGCLSFVVKMLSGLFFVRDCDRR